MRTTLTLDPTVAERISRLVHAGCGPMKDIVNQALREGLKTLEASSTVRRGRFLVEPHDFGARPGIDLDTIARLGDEIEDRAVAAGLKSVRPPDTGQ